MSNVLAAIRDARVTGTVAEASVADLPESVDAAYALVAQQLPDVAAWKIGGANPWSQKVFGNTDVFFGGLASEELYVDTREVPLSGLCAPLAEPEIMLEIKDPEAGSFGRMALGFEIPASVLPAELKSTLTGQICDRAGAGAIWIGAFSPFDEAALEVPFVSEFTLNGGDPVAGSSLDIKGGPLGAAAEFIRLAKHYGFTLRAGQWIATGGLNPAVRVAPGDQLEFSALGRSISLKFS